MDMNRILTSELRRLYEAASPGIWSAKPDPCDPEYHHVVSSASGLTASMEQDGVTGRADAALIAAMHEALPALLGVYESAVWEATPEEREAANGRLRHAKQFGAFSAGISSEEAAIAYRALERIDVDEGGDE